MILTKNGLEESYTRLAKFLSKDHSIEVVFTGDKCDTNGRVIRLPSPPHPITEDLASWYEGYTYHEVGHILYTDFGLLDDALTTKDSVDRKLFHTVWNFLEDVRQERLLEKRFIPASNILRNLHVKLNHKVRDVWDSVKVPMKILSALFIRLRFGETKFTEEFIEPEVREHMNNCFRMLEPYPLKTAQDAIDAAEVLLDYLKEHEDELGLDDEEGQKQVETGVVEGTPLTMEALKDLVETSVSALTEVDNEMDAPYIPYTTEHDIVENMSVENEQKARTNLSLARSEGRVVTEIVRKRLVNILRSQTRSRWASGKSHGVLDSRRLSNAVLSGSLDSAHKVRTNRESLDVCVSIAIDHSGSMKTRLPLAVQSTVVLGDVLKALNIPFQVFGFSTESFFEYMPSGMTSSSRFSRWNQLWIGLYKDFQESWDLSAPALAEDPVKKMKSNTLDGESLLWGARQLLSRPEKRKIFLWLNDGEPWPGFGNPAICRSYVHDAVKMIEGSGIELLAFGIETASVSRYFPNHVVIRQLDDLVVAPLKELDQKLRRRV